MKKWIAFLTFLSCVNLSAQSKDQKLVMITLDGFRWNEVFTGADSVLIHNKTSVRQKNKQQIYWKCTSDERRKILMPFFWNVIAKHGQLYGNRALDNYVNVKNRYWFSYPGYNEMFTGFPDTAINSNNFPPNPHVNVLEFLNRQPGYTSQVAVFAGWNAYYRILNAGRSKLPINAGWTDLSDEPLNETQKVLSRQQHVMPQPFGPTERIDAATYYIAKEHVKKHHPKILYLAFIDTDGYGHRGEYDYYLDAAHNTDRMIGDLWDYLQSDPFYKNQTTLLITTDHGRGADSVSWKSHKNTIPHCDEIWLAAIGPNTPALGEVKTPGQLYQNQVAKTIAALLGFNFTSRNPIGETIKTVFK